MALIHSPWLNVVAATIGGVTMGLGLGSLYNGFSPGGMFWSVLGFVIMGWAIFDRRRYRRGTPESKGKTVE